MAVRGAHARTAFGSRTISTEVLLIGAVTVWAFNFPAAKYALTHGFSPLAYAAPRFVVAGLVLGLIMFARERTLRVRRSDVPLLVGAAIVGIFLQQLTFVYALRLTGAATVALLFGVAPILIGIVAHLSGREHLSPRSWSGAALSFVGVALVASGVGGGLLSVGVGGILLGLATAATFAVFSVAVMPLVTEYSPYRLTAVITLIGTPPLLAFAVPQLAQQDWSAIGLLAWLAFLYSIVAYVLGFMVWFAAIEGVGPSTAALYSNLEPFLAAIFAVIVLSEHLSLFQVFGGAIIAAGIFIARQSRPQFPLAE